MCKEPGPLSELHTFSLSMIEYSICACWIASTGQPAWNFGGRSMPNHGNRAPSRFESVLAVVMNDLLCLLEQRTSTSCTSRGNLSGVQSILARHYTQLFIKAVHTHQHNGQQHAARIRRVRPQTQALHDVCCCRFSSAHSGPVLHLGHGLEQTHHNKCSRGCGSTAADPWAASTWRSGTRSSRQYQWQQQLPARH